MKKTLPQPHRKVWYKRWWFWTLVVLAALTVIGIMVGQSAYRQYQKQNLSYLNTTASPQNRTLKKTISTNGTVVADEQVSLSFTAGSKVKHVNFAVGDDVSKDDVIAESDFQKIKAPFDGRIIAVSTFVDDVVTPGKPIITYAFRSSHIEFTASESEVVSLAVDQVADLTIPAVNDGKDMYSGKVNFIDIQKAAGTTVNAAGTTDSGYTVTVSADGLPENLRSILGLSVDVVITVAQKDNALSLEPAAIQYNEDGSTFVYLAPDLTDAFYQQAMGTTDVTSLLTKRTVTAGFIGDDYTEVTSGLTAQDKVLLFIPKS